MFSLGWTILIICIFAGGILFFAVNAIALRTFSRSKLQDAFEQANKQDFSEYIVDTAERMTLACRLYQIILSSFVVGLILISIGNSFWPLALLISIAIIFTFGLAVPNAWSKYAGEKVLCRTYRLLILVSIPALPVLYIYRLIDALARRLAGVHLGSPLQQQEERQEEFLTDLEQHRMEGAVDKEEQEMIENVLDLTDTTADEIMTPRTDIIAVEADAPLQTILETVTSAGHSRLPVYSKNIDNITGFVYAKDLLTEIGRDFADFKLSGKIRQAYFVPETKPLRTLLHEFQNQKLHIAVVLDEYGGTAGIITIEDILEELVGEITDEYEEKQPEPVKRIDETTIEVDARTYIDDLNDDFKLNLPEDEDYDTVGGFVFSYLGYIPKTSETFDYKNLTFIISAAETRKIKRIRIQMQNTNPQQ